MIRRIVPLVAVAALALSPVLTACGSGSGSTSSNGLPTVKLMVGGIDKQIYLPYKLADQLGFYKKYGVDVILSTEQSGGVGAEDAMVSGQVDMAGAWYNHTIDYGLQGKSVEDVVQLSGAPGERIMCSNNSGVHTPADIKGKTMGVTDLGSGTDTLTQFVASKGGVGHSDYHTVAVGAGATAIAALQHGTADCVMTTQPTVQAIETQHIGYSAFDLATSAGATKLLGGAWPAAGVLAKKDWVDQNKDTVQKVVDALVATMHWIHTHSAADVEKEMPSAYTNNGLVTPATYTSALTQDYGQFLPDGIMPAGGPKTIFDMYKTIGTDPSKVSIASTFTNDFADSALKLEHIKPTTTPAGPNG
ncbi:MAG: ABC transporter substrate-binding protein [Nocardioidaceae bacterium]|nr:ABC transporter substrate-binding protein [Nocardioidaceae bacterium]MCL2613241.1 ABC transporter substrate-binding protein [Nocardioidaceae bacterium]